MKISIITVVYNADAFLKDCIQSVIEQTYSNIEYIIVDGGSTDDTISIVESYGAFISHFISEKDRGLYDAINKGIKFATGDIIGLLNADDMLSDRTVLQKVANQFIQSEDIQGVYGDLNYVHPSTGRTIREWKSRQSSIKDFEKGWMPAHPTLYLKKDLFAEYGNYALDMGTVADYDLILRYFYIHRIRAKYLPYLFINMRTGGVSNRSLGSLLRAAYNDFRALKRNNIPKPLLVLFYKKLSKLEQFRRRDKT